MSVNNVPSFDVSKLNPQQRADYEKMTPEQQQQFVIEFNQKQADPNAPIAGTVVESTGEPEVTPEEQLTKAEKRAAAKAAKEAEIAAAKEEAARAAKEKADALYKPEELNPVERAFAEEAVKRSGSNKPLYKNAKARRELRKMLKEWESDLYKEVYDKAIEAAGDDADLKAQLEKDKARALKKSHLNRSARIYGRDIRIGDRVEHTRVFDSAKEKRETKREIGDEGKGLRFKVHNKQFIKAENENLHNRMERDGVSSHEAAHRMIVDEEGRRISGDRTFEPNEVHNLAAKSSNKKSHDCAAKSESKKLGYAVKDDTWKNVLAGISTAALTALGANAVPIMIDVTAGAYAAVVSATGEVIKEASETVSTTQAVHNWSAGAVAGVIAGGLAASLFGGTKDEDILHGVGVHEVFQDVATPDGTKRAYEMWSFKSEKDTENVKMLLRAIDQLDLSDADKTQFLAEAAGDKSQRILSKKELVLAYIKACNPEEQKPVNPVPEPECPECPDCHEGEEPPEEEVAPVPDGGDDGDSGRVPGGDDGSRPVRPGEDDGNNGPKPPIDGKTQEQTMVTVMNGEGFARLAKKYGVSVDDIIALNQDKIHKYTDCNGKVHKFFRVGAQITLPAGANAEAIADNQENVNANTEKNKYRRATTSKQNVDKLADENCDPKTRAQGSEVDKLVKEELKRREEKTIKNLEAQLRSSVLSPEARVEVEAQYKALTGKDFAG